MKQSIIDTTQLVIDSLSHQPILKGVVPGIVSIGISELTEKSDIEIVNEYIKNFTLYAGAIIMALTLLVKTADTYKRFFNKKQN